MQTSLSTSATSGIGLNSSIGAGSGVSLSTATLPALPIDAALGQAVGVSLQLASHLAVFALIIFGIRKAFELSFGGKL